MKKSIEIIVDETDILDGKTLDIAVLGSGVPKSYFKHLSSDLIKKIVFVDKIKLDDGMYSCLRPPNYNHDDPDLESLREIIDNDEIDLPEKYFEAYKYSETLNGRSPVLMKDDFNSKTEFLSEKTIDNFIADCKKSKQRFDVIIISKVLSNINTESPNVSPILESVRDIMNEDAFIFLRVNGKNYETQKDRSLFHNYSIENLLEITSNFQLLTSPETIILDEIECSNSDTEKAEEYWVVLK